MPGIHRHREPARAVPWDRLAAGLFDFQTAPGRYAVVRNEPRLLFDHATPVLQLASGRPVAGLPQDAALEARLREAARFFVRVAMLRQGADHFTLLGLVPDFDPATLREHYRMLIRLTHPDFAAGAEAWPADAATRINLANDVLSSEERRQAYGLTLKRQPLRAAAVMPVGGSVPPPPGMWREEAAGRRLWPVVGAGVGMAALLLLWLWPSQTPEEKPAQLAQASGSTAQPATPAKAGQEAGTARAARAEDSPSPIRLAVAPVAVALPPPALVPAAISSLPPPPVPAPAPPSPAPLSSVLSVSPLPVAAIPSPTLVPPIPPARAPLPVVAAASVRVPEKTLAQVPAPPPVAVAPVAEAAVLTKAAPPAVADEKPAPLQLSPVLASVSVPSTRGTGAQPAVVAAAPAPMPAPALVAQFPRMVDVQPLLGQLLGALHSGRGEQVAGLVDRSARQGDGGARFAETYNRFLSGARVVRVGPVRFSGLGVGEQLVVDGVVQLHTQEDGQPVLQRELVVRALFASRGGQPVLTHIGSGDGQ